MITRNEINKEHAIHTTKMRIMDESVKLFAGRGYAATSIKDISKAAKVNIAAVNYHFKSKENLYKQLLLRFAEAGNAHFEKTLMPAKSLDEFKVRLEMFLGVGLEGILKNPDLPKMLMKNMDLMPQISEVVFVDNFQTPHVFLEKFFRDAQKKGIIRKDLDCKIIAQFIDNQMFAVIHKIIIEKNLKKDISDPKFRRKWLEHTLELFFNGVLEK